MYNLERLMSKPFAMLGMVFAPLSLPFERRMQTVGMLNVIFFMMHGYSIAFILLNIYLFFFTSYWWLTVAYAAWYVYDYDSPETGGRKIEYCFMRRWPMWPLFASYFPMKLVRTHDLDPEKSYLLGYHPHGVLGYGAIAAFATDALKFSEAFPGLTARLITLRLNFLVPGGRELGLFSGMCSSSKQSLGSILRPNGNAAVLVVGGATESLNCGDKHKVKLYLIRRKGFVKLALQHGRELVPVFGFGENEIYEQVDNPEGSRVRKFQEWLKGVTTFTLPLFHGRGIFQYSYGLVPYRKPVTVVVGSPIPVPKIENPTNEEVQEYHAKYMSALQKLYNEYNPKYGNPDIELAIG